MARSIGQRTVDNQRSRGAAIAGSDLADSKPDRFVFRVHPNRRIIHLTEDWAIPSPSGGIQSKVYY